jgi:hypothetical protein
MSDIIIVLPFTNEETAKTERLLDHIFHIGGVPGHILLVSAHDVHPEARERIKVAADVAFSSYEMIAVNPPLGKTKDERINFMFKQVAKYVQDTYRLPWFLMEPDCTPVSETWYHSLCTSYKVQPKRYCGSFFKAGSTLFCSRRIVYPFDAFKDLEQYCNGDAAFNFAAATFQVPRATKTQLVQEIVIATATDLSKVSANAVIIHSDKRSIALSMREEAISPKKENPHPASP